MNQGYNSTASILRWAARATSLFTIALLLLFAFGESEPALRPTPREWVGLAFFPIGVCVGLALAWWREGLGVAVTVLSLAAFYLIYCALITGRMPGGPWFAVFASPAALFFASWLLRRGGGATTMPRPRASSSL